MCEFIVGGYRKVVKTLIQEDGAPGVMCILPVAFTNDVEEEAYKGAIKEYVLGKERVGMNVLTRSMAKKEKEMDENEEGFVEQDLWSVVTPESEEVHEPLVGVDDQSKPLKTESRVGEEYEGVEAEGSPDADEPPVSAPMEPDEGKAIPLEELSSGSGSESELSRVAGEIGPVGEGQDKDEFVKEIKSDEGLKEWRELAERRERGFKWKKGILARSMYVNWEEYRDVIVLPKSYRERVMILGHDRNRHLGADKVAKMIGRHFAWPGMVREIVDYCKSCRVCQVKSKYRPRRAPVVERPILAEPFESVAIDLVGPLPKGKNGNRYILTYICLATKWPEAVPLRAITAKSVVEGLWLIFSRTSIPERVLSDQGTQFCSKVMGQFCEWLGIERVRTSAYHPETNGSVERMHGTMKSILGKCVSEGLDWVGQLCFVMYVLRQMPHADSGYSPFDLVYGFRVRTPLDALYYGLYEKEVEGLNVCEWVAKMAERLESVRDSAALRIARGKESRMQYANKVEGVQGGGFGIVQGAWNDMQVGGLMGRSV